METKISPNSPSQPIKGDLTRTLALVGCMAALAGAALWQATMGFRVVATEEGRRLAVAEAPLALPRVDLALPGATKVPLPSLLAGDRRPAIVTFFYARCNAVCSVQGTELQQMQREILARGLQDKLRLLTISLIRATHWTTWRIMRPACGLRRRFGSSPRYPMRRSARLCLIRSGSSCCRRKWGSSSTTPPSIS